MIRVTIKKCSADGQSWSTQIRRSTLVRLYDGVDMSPIGTKSELYCLSWDAARYAITKIFGKTAHFERGANTFKDFSTYYGTVFLGGIPFIGRARIDIEGLE